MGALSTSMLIRYVSMGSAASSVPISPCSLEPTMMPVTSRRIKRRVTGIEAVFSRDSVCCPSLHRNQPWALTIGRKGLLEEEEKARKDSVTAEKMDDWIKESIEEIVKNIGEAPFLVQIFSHGPSILRLHSDGSPSSTWQLVKNGWSESNLVPDGIILVEELDDDGKAIINKKWGLAVQGRGMDCAASCYILDTCRVSSVGGFCTHFCLVKAKCFGETSDKQLSKAWLHGR